MQIVPNSLIAIILSDAYLDIHIACRSSALARSTLVVEAESGAGIDTARYLHGEFTLSSPPALAPTIVAWMVDQLTGTAAFRACNDRHHRSKKGLSCRLHASVSITP